MKIGLVRAELPHSEGRTDRQMDKQTEKQADTTNLTVAFSQFSNVPKHALLSEINFLTNFPVLLTCTTNYLLSITRLTDSWAICCMLSLLKSLLSIDKLNGSLKHKFHAVRLVL